MPCTWPNVVTVATEGTDDCMEVGGRVMQDDSMDGIGRVESGTETEQLPKSRKQIIAISMVSVAISFRGYKIIGRENSGYDVYCPLRYRDFERHRGTAHDRPAWLPGNAGENDNLWVG